MTSTSSSLFALNRRRFLQLVATSSGLWALAACSPVVPSAQAPTVPVTAGQPQRGGAVSIAFSAPMTNLAPHRGFTLPDLTIERAFYESLGWADASDPTYPIRPLLAESWEISEEGKVVTFNLRQGVKFSHGTSLAAEDVVDTFVKRILNPDFAYWQAASVSYIDKVEAVDEQTVRFTLKEPIASAVRDIATLPIAPHDRTDEQMAQESTGTGAFKLANYLPSDRVKLVRNEDYWAENLPYLDEAQILLLPDTVAQVAALTGGTVDALWQLGTENLATLQANTDVKLVENKLGDYDIVVMRTTAKPFDDVRVRQAIKYAVDRQALLQAVLQGHGSVGNDQPIVPASPFWGNVPVAEYSVDKARALLAEAGYDQGLALTLVYAPIRPAWEATAVALQAMLEAMGITLTLEKTPVEGYWGGPFANANFALSWGLGYIDPGMLLNTEYRSNALFNATAWQNADLDKLIDEAVAAQDESKRKEIYTQIQTLISEEGAVLIPYFRADIKAMSTYVQGLVADTIPNLREVSRDN